VEETLIRGKIRNRDFARQLRDFSGLRWGNITPTDIDGYFEIGDRIFVFIEIKYGTTEVPFGQKLALERLVDIIGETRDAILIIGSHHDEAGTDIDVAPCVVREYRTSNVWHSPTKKTTIVELINQFSDYIGDMGNSVAFNA